MREWISREEEAERSGAPQVRSKSEEVREKVSPVATDLNCKQGL